jgi:hypothetical protein
MRLPVALQTIDSIEERRVTRAQRIGNKLQQIQNYYGDTGMANAGFRYARSGCSSRRHTSEDLVAVLGGGSGRPSWLPGAIRGRQYHRRRLSTVVRPRWLPLQLVAPLAVLAGGLVR